MYQDVQHFIVTVSWDVQYILNIVDVCIRRQILTSKVHTRVKIVILAVDT